MIGPESAVRQFRETVRGAQSFKLPAFTDDVIDVFKQTMHLNRTATMIQGWIQGQAVPVFLLTRQGYPHLAGKAGAIDRLLPSCQQQLLVTGMRVPEKRKWRRESIRVERMQRVIGIGNAIALDIHTPEHLRNSGKKGFDTVLFPAHMVQLPTNLVQRGIPVAIRYQSDIAQCELHQDRLQPLPIRLGHILFRDEVLQEINKPGVCASDPYGFDASRVASFARTKQLGFTPAVFLVSQDIEQEGEFGADRITDGHPPPFIRVEHIGDVGIVKEVVVVDLGESCQPCNNGFPVTAQKNQIVTGDMKDIFVFLHIKVRPGAPVDITVTELSVPSTTVFVFFRHQVCR